MEIQVILTFTYQGICNSQDFCVENNDKNSHKKGGGGMDVATHSALSQTPQDQDRLEPLGYEQP